MMRACRWRIGCICRRRGLRMLTVATRRKCLRTSCSRPSRRSRLSRFAGHARAAFLATWRCWMPATATTPSCVWALPSLESATWPASSRRPWCGRRVVHRGRAPKKGRRDAPNTTSVKDLALGLRAKAWRTIKWREGTNEWLSSRFARVRVHVASSHERHGKPAKEWLLIEWPEGEKEPTKYWLSTLPANVTFRDLVDAAKLRWRIERDYQELKQEVGLGHYEWRGWSGFHH